METIFDYEDVAGQIGEEYSKLNESNKRIILAISLRLSNSLPRDVNDILDEDALIWPLIGFDDSTLLRDESLRDILDYMIL